MLKRKSGTLIVLALAFSVATPSQATVIALTGFSDFGPNATQLTFAGLPGGALVGGSVAGVGFSVGTATGFVASDPFGGRTGPPDPLYVDNRLSATGGFFDPMIIDFPGLINAVGFEARTNTADGVDLTAQLMANGNVVGTINYADPGNTLWSFYGIRSSVPFDQLVIDPDNDQNGYIRLDNLTYETPEPTTLALLGLALAGLGWSRRRMR